MEKKTNGFAIAGIILSIIGGVLLTLTGFILSIIGLIRSKGCNSGKGVAIAGIVISIIKVIGMIIVAILFVAAINSDEFDEGFCKGLGSNYEGICTKKDDGTYSCYAVFKTVICDFDEKDKDKEEEKETKEEEKKEEKKEETKKEEKTISKDMNKLIDFFINNFNSTYTDITNKKLSDNDKLYMAYKYVGDGYSNTTKSEIEKNVYKFFGKDTKYTNADIKFIYTGEVMVKYDSSKGTYTWDSSSAHGYSAPLGFSYEISRKYYDDTIEVRLKRVYYLTRDTGPIEKIYSDPELKKEIEVSKKYYSEMPGCEDCAEEDKVYGISVEDYLKGEQDNIDTVVFEFKVEDNNPVFSRVYIEK